VVEIAADCARRSPSTQGLFLQVLEIHAMIPIATVSGSFNGRIVRWPISRFKSLATAMTSNDISLQVGYLPSDGR
jgi:hypothetical protein